MLAPEPPAIRDLVGTLSALVRAEVPGATERVNLGWRSLNFSHPQMGYFLGLFPRQENVLVVFEFGALLDDPDAILEGTGAQVRQLTFLPGAPIPAEPLRRLIRAALDLPAGRATRVAMLNARRHSA